MPKGACSELWLVANVKITARERGKRLPKQCRESHNIWVNLGREFLARVIAPNTAFTDHYAENPPSFPREFVQFMGVGIGGDSQTHVAAYSSPLKDDYPPAAISGLPGDVGNQQTDTNLAATYLERPVKISATSPIWLKSVATPVTFLNANKTLKLTTVFSESDINSVGPYTTVPVSETALVLSTQDPDAVNVYDLLNTPTMVGAGRQTVVAYNTMEPLAKTVSFAFSIEWELRF